MNVYILLGVWLVFWVAGWWMAKNQWKAKQPIAMGWLISLPLIIVWMFGMGIYSKEPVPEVSTIATEPITNKTETLSMITSMQTDATKIHLWTQNLKNKAERAYETGDVYPLGEVNDEIQRLAKKIWNGRGDTAPAFEICDDNLISDLSLYNLAMLAKLDGKERADHELPYFKDNFYKNYEACKDVIFRQTAEEIHNQQL